MVVIPDRQATQPAAIGSLESILGLLKSLKIRALEINSHSSLHRLLRKRLMGVCVGGGGNN
jgi:hypothetical protein